MPDKKSDKGKISSAVELINEELGKEQSLKANKKNKRSNGKGTVAAAALLGIFAVIVVAAVAVIQFKSQGIQIFSQSDKEVVQQYTASTSTSTTQTQTAATTTAIIAAAEATESTTAAASSTKKTTTTATTRVISISDSAVNEIYVYLKSQLVVAYDADGNVVKAFICSSGKSSTPTRTGTYAIHHKYRWRLMIGNCYTQYASAFSGSYLIHSIPYSTKNASTMYNQSYDKLGSTASAGCIRLCCRDSKWVYDNCEIGTPVIVVNESAPNGITGESIPSRIKSAAYNGWDPTDPSSDNPYNQL